MKKAKELNMCTRNNNVIFNLDNCDLILSEGHIRNQKN